MKVPVCELRGLRGRLTGQIQQKGVTVPDSGSFEAALAAGDQAVRVLTQAGWSVVGSWDAGEEPEAICLRHPDCSGVFITVSGHQDEVAAGWIQ